jgi:hypothetical protein
MADGHTRALAPAASDKPTTAWESPAARIFAAAPPRRLEIWRIPMAALDLSNRAENSAFAKFGRAVTAQHARQVFEKSGPMVRFENGTGSHDLVVLRIGQGERTDGRR